MGCGLSCSKNVEIIVPPPRIKADQENSPAPIRDGHRVPSRDDQPSPELVGTTFPAIVTDEDLLSRPIPPSGNLLTFLARDVLFACDIPSRVTEPYIYIYGEWVRALVTTLVVTRKSLLGDYDRPDAVENVERFQALLSVAQQTMHPGTASPARRLSTRGGHSLHSLSALSGPYFEDGSEAPMDPVDDNVRLPEVEEEEEQDDNLSNTWPLRGATEIAPTSPANVNRMRSYGESHWSLSPAPNSARRSPRAANTSAALSAFEIQMTSLSTSLQVSNRVVANTLDVPRLSARLMQSPMYRPHHRTRARGHAGAGINGLRGDPSVHPTFQRCNSAPPFFSPDRERLPMAGPTVGAAVLRAHQRQHARMLISDFYQRGPVKDNSVSPRSFAFPPTLYFHPGARKPTKPSSRTEITAQLDALLTFAREVHAGVPDEPTLRPLAYIYADGFFETYITRDDTGAAVRLLMFLKDALCAMGNGSEDNDTASLPNYAMHRLSSVSSNPGTPRQRRNGETGKRIRSITLTTPPHITLSTVTHDEEP